MVVYNLQMNYFTLLNGVIPCLKLQKVDIGVYFILSTGYLNEDEVICFGVYL